MIIDIEQAYYNVMDSKETRQKLTVIHTMWNAVRCTNRFKRLKVMYDLNQDQYPEAVHVENEGVCITYSIWGDNAEACIKDTMKAITEMLQN
jgi:hypothetical protein